MINSKIISALIGLVGAIQNNGKTDSTDFVIREAIVNINERDLEAEIIKKIHKEKYLISPNCFCCESPCGNTSDFDLDKLKDNNKELLELKDKLICVIYNKILSGEDINDEMIKGISYISYDLPLEMYNELIETIKG